MTDKTLSLGDIRKEIDSIDEQIQDLLIRRTEVVEMVRAIKEGDPVKIRPSREAEMMYRLTARHHGNFPKRELVRIWREIIVATLTFEGPFSVAVIEDADEPGYWDMARDLSWRDQSRTKSSENTTFSIPKSQSVLLPSLIFHQPFGVCRRL